METALAGGAALTIGGLLPGAASARTPGRGRGAKHVVLVDWDGFDPDYLGRVATPNVDALAARGSLSTARGSYRSISNPARATMSTGAYPPVHGNVAYV